MRRKIYQSDEDEMLLAQQQRKREQAGLTAYRKPGLYAGNRHPWTLPTIASLPLPLVASNLPQLQESMVMMMMMPAILLPSPHLVMVPCTLLSLQDDGHIKKTSWSPCNCNSQVFFRPSKLQFTLESLKFQLLSWVYRDRLGRWHQEASPVYLQVQKLG
jgi:hypothetical protein